MAAPPPPAPDRLAAIAAQALLDALEGVAWLTDIAGTILAVGQRGWTQFADENAVPWLTAETVVGTSLFDAIVGEPVRDAYWRMHAAVASGRRTQTVFEYRCDSPIAERHMRMSISGVRSLEQVTAVLYQSQMLAELRRLPLPLFASDRRAAPRLGAGGDIVTLCAFCQRVAWPAEAEQSRRRRWITAVEFYRRGGPANAAISDGICAACIKRVVAQHV